METSQVVILGCGYTGRRVAELLRARGTPVVATTRDPGKLSDLAQLGATVLRLEVLEPEALDDLAAAVADGARILHSIPVVEGPEGPLDPTPRLLAALADKPSRMVYLSTTGVYGRILEVDETTPAEAEPLRLAAERAVAAGNWPSLVLRPAAIYGPGRGVHESIRRGRYRLVGDGSNYSSRIHVADLAALAVAALDSQVTGSYPVADDDPSTSLEIAEYCALLLGMPLPPVIDPSETHHTRRSDRRTDGRAIRQLLGVPLHFPSYRIGVPAAMQAAAREE